MTPATHPQAEKESAAIIGFTSAIAAYGAFFIPKAFGTSIAPPAGRGALWGFLIFYVTACAHLVRLHPPGGPAARHRARPRPALPPPNPAEGAPMSHFLDRLTFFRKKPFSDGHGVTTDREPRTGRTPIASAGSTTRSCARPTA
jgi:hypothetical protein